MADVWPSPDPGTLSAAYYTQSFSYDVLDRLTSGPLGAYTYGDTNHLHAATAVGSGPTYTASYDGAGNMVCRAPTPAVGSCAMGQNTGQQLTYDAEGRLSHWQNAPGGSPTASASFRYDGEGERVAQQTTSSGTTTTTRYLLGGLEELTTVGSTSTLTKYYSVPGVVTAIKVGSTLSYLATDGLGSVSVALNASGSATGQALYLPYGAGRYASGLMPTARGYTGQYQDATSGLDYYGARYYDPALGQFTSADSVLDGLNRYAYVHDNPTTAIDPTGHDLWEEGEAHGGGIGYVDTPFQTGDGDTASGDGGSGTGAAIPWTSPDLLNAAPGIEGDETGDVINQGIHNDAVNGPRTLDFTAEEGSGAGSDAVNTATLAGDGELAAGDTAGGSSGDPGSGTGTGTGTGTGGGDGGGTGTPSGGCNDGNEGGDSWGNGGNPTSTLPQSPDTTGNSVDTNPTDLYRSGNQSGPITPSTPRIGKDVFPDANGNISPTHTSPAGNPAGISTFQSPGGVKGWWKLPAGTRLPSGLVLVNDDPAVGHWTILPAYEMSVDMYRQLLLDIQGWIPIWR